MPVTYLSVLFFFVFLQLSSKCDNRLFRIRFEVLKVAGFPFLETLSRPIRCISRNRTVRTCSIICKKTPAAIHPVDGSQSCGFDDGSVEIQNNTVREAKPSPSSKRVRLEQEKISAMEQPEGEYDSHPRTANEVFKGFSSTIFIHHYDQVSCCF